MKTPAKEKDLLDDFDNKNLEDYPPKLLRKMVRQLLAERSRKPGQTDDEEAEAAEEEREKLADLHAEKKGAVPSVPVTSNDLPVELTPDEDESEEDGEEEKLAESKSKKPKAKA